jgi:CheY-like chemotaxis protein
MVTTASVQQSVMIVEDDDGMREMLASAVEDLGYAVLVARNGEDALVQLTGHEGISLVLMDMSMPHGNGWELMEALRQRPGASVTPVVVMTGLDCALPEGATDLLRKPFGVEDLRRCVRRHVT